MYDRVGESSFQPALTACRSCSSLPRTEEVLPDLSAHVHELTVPVHVLPDNRAGDRERAADPLDLDAVHLLGRADEQAGELAQVDGVDDPLELLDVFQVLLRTLAVAAIHAGPGLLHRPATRLLQAAHGASHDVAGVGVVRVEGRDGVAAGRDGLLWRLHGKVLIDDRAQLRAQLRHQAWQVRVECLCQRLLGVLDAWGLGDMWWYTSMFASHDVILVRGWGLANTECALPRRRKYKFLYFLLLGKK